jgi:uncharacterized protein (DUF2252 family)
VNNDRPQTPAERYEHGQSLRQRTSIESHAQWPLDGQRANPVALIEEQNIGRVPELVPVRRARMSRSPFAFYRGAARIMAADLSRTPTSGILTQLCGDAHLANFGVYASPERRLVFDLNDFDETLPGPWEWDIKRLAASLFIAGRHNGIGDQRTRKVTRRCVESYRKAMSDFAKSRLTDVWYNLFEAEKMLESLTNADEKKSAAKLFKKVMRKDSRHALDRLAEEVDGRYRIRSEPPLLIPLREIKEGQSVEEMQSWILAGFAGYRQNLPDEMDHLLKKFRIVDFAYKVVGVGSVGTKCGVLLLEGRDRHDPLLLQIKQSNKSVLEDHLPASCYKNSAERVVQGARLMQSATDIFMGWTENRISGSHFYWRQLKDWKGSVDVDNVGYKQLKRMAGFRGWTLARSHARSGDAIAISSYLDSGNSFEKSITEFSARYADQNERDYEAYMTEIRDAGLEVSNADE